MYQFYIEKFNESDFDRYFSLVSNSKVMEQITERAIPLEEAKINYQKLLMRNEQHTLLGSYKIYNESMNQFIGLGHLTIHEELRKEAEVGYMILPEHWGKRYGTEIAKLLIDIAQNTELVRLTAIIDPRNKASKKILIRQGFLSEKICEIDGLPGEILSKQL